MKPGAPPNNFIDHFPLKVDSKNRVVVPPMFRDILKEHYKEDNNTMIVTISMEKNIAVFPQSSFDSYVKKLKEKSQFKSNVRNLTNAISMSSSLEKLDSAGKITIKGFLKEQANIDKEVYVVGCVDHFEIWQKEKFEEYISTYIQQLSALGDTLD